MLSNENKIVQSMWIPDSFSNNELLGMASYLFHGHEVHLYSYSKSLKNLPQGVIIKDANEIISNKEIFKDLFATYTAFADWFRFKLLYEKGGWWVDLDTVCLQPLKIPEKYCFSTEMDTQGNHLLNPTCIKCPKESPFLRECLEFIEKHGKQSVGFGEFGLKLYRSVLNHYEYMSYVRPPSTFCPVNWFELYQLISLVEYTPSSSTYTIHLWNDMWRRGCLNKNATYHPQSIYERLKRKYLTVQG